ncbi:MAG: acyltransferase [Moorellales bacterium]
MLACRDRSIDALKGAAIAGVVAIHVLAVAGRGTPMEVFLLGVAARFSTPAFFFASGWLFRPKPGETLRAYLVRRAKKLLPPYLAWVAADLALSCLLLRRPSWREALWTCLTGQGMVMWQLYFIPALLQCCLFAFLSRRAAAAVAVLSFASLVGTDAAALAEPEAAGAVIAAVRSTWLPWVGYFLLGRLLREAGFDPRRANSPLLALASAGGLLALSGNAALDLRAGVPPLAALDFFKPGVALCAVPAILLILALAEKAGAAARLLAALGRRSAGVYFVHMAVLWSLWAAGPGLFSPGLLVPTALLALGASALAAECLVRSRLAFLAGGPSRAPALFLEPPRNTGGKGGVGEDRSPRAARFNSNQDQFKSEVVSADAQQADFPSGRLRAAGGRRNSGRPCPSPGLGD